MGGNPNAVRSKLSLNQVRFITGIKGLALAGLLALIVGASVNAVQPAELIAASVGGVIGNRVDVGFISVCKCLINALKGQASTPISEVLRKALWLSYLQALVSICSERKVELVGDFPRQWRGQPVYSREVKADIRWLDSKLAGLKQEIKAVEVKDARLPEISVQDLEGFVASEERDVVLGVVRSLTNSTTAADTIPLYIEKLEQPKDGLIDRAFGFFAKQLSDNPELHAFFETQLLVQIDGRLAAQQITLQAVNSNLQKVAQEVSEEVPQKFVQVMDKLALIESGISAADDRPDIILGLIKDLKALLSGTQRGSVEQTDAVSLVVSDENPFGPLGGRIDSPDQFFGREQTLKWIFETLNSGSSVALIGDREMGKSSLLKAVEANAKDFLQVYRKPIYLDLRNVADEDDFYYALCHQAGIPQCKGFRLARELKPKRLLLIIDEIEKMTWDGFTNQVRGQLRGLAEGKDAPLRLVVAASKSLDRLFPDSADGNMVSPLSGICLEESVKAWDATVIRAFVADRLQTTSAQFSETEIIRIIQSSQGQPRKVVNLCYQHYASLQGQP